MNQNVIISISAIPGSFTEQAAHKFAADSKLSGVTYTYDGDARGSFEAVASEKAAYGIVPIENSNSGLVMSTMYAAANFTYHIERIVEISVQQNLITMPDIKREDITAITSQRPAIDQCKAYLHHYWPEIIPTDYIDTALAVKDLAEGKLARTTAVIASRNAAELYHLPILEASIQDLKFNFTAFMVISKHRAP